MSGHERREPPQPSFLLEQRGVHRATRTPSWSAAPSTAAGRTAAFALGDGTVHLVPLADRETGARRGA